VLRIRRLYWPHVPVVPLLHLLACVLLVATHAFAQGLPSEAISVANGRVVFGGEVFVTAGEEDPGWFNYTDYEYSALRNFRASLSTEVRPSSRVQFLAEVRLDHGEHLSAYALFLRLRPWPERRFDVQVGRVPPTFGAFNRTVYAYDNIVIGQPLAYQYLLTLRTDAVPRTADDLLRQRGNGWSTQYPVGSNERVPGVPLFNNNRYDTGVQVHGVKGPFEWIGAVTTGTLSDPRLSDNNGRPQLVGRAIVQLGPAVKVGASGARGAWLDETLDPSLPTGQRAVDFRQAAWAVDAEASAGRWLARAEWLQSSWRLPEVAAPYISEPVLARSLIVEGRVRLSPGLSVAARGDALSFADLAGSTVTLPWEAPTRRLESALTIKITRNINAKFAVQMNRRDGGRVRHDTLLAGQLVYWF
jgi:hypothetical protein